MMTKEEIYENARENLLFIQHQQATELKELGTQAPETLRAATKQVAGKLKWLQKELDKIRGVSE